MKPNKIFFLLISLFVAFQLNAAERHTFLGPIGNSYVNMDVFMLDDNEIAGSDLYYRENPYRLVSDDIDLSGNWYYQSNGTITLNITERTRSGQYCGQWNLVYNKRTQLVTGTMTNSQGKRFKVRLTSTY